jgi:hypothetical protein
MRTFYGVLSLFVAILLFSNWGMSNLYHALAQTSYNTTSSDQSTNQTISQNATLPKVLFPTSEEIAEYMASAVVNFTDLSDGNTGNASHAQIAASKNNTFVVWQDNTPGNFDIYLSVSRDGGLHFVGPVNLSNNTGNSTDPQIGILEKEVFVLWQDNTPGNFDIFVSVSMDEGNTFKTYDLTNSTSDSIDPKVNVDGYQALWLWIERICGNQQENVTQSNSTNNHCSQDKLYSHPNRSW